MKFVCQLGATFKTIFDTANSGRRFNFLFYRNGQGLIEALMAATLITSVTLFFLISGYVFLGKIWLTHQGEEALVCVSEGRSTEECRAQFRDSAKFLGGKAVENIELVKTFNIWKLSWNWHIPGGKTLAMISEMRDPSRNFRR